MKKYLAFIIMLTLLGCKHNQPIEFGSFETLQLPDNVFARKVRFVNDSVGYAVGGNRGEIGRLYKTLDKGTTWQQKLQAEEHSLYEVFMVDSLKGIAGGESMRVYTTKDGGENWDRLYMWPNLPEYSVDISDVKNIRQYNDTTLLMACGDDYSAGLFVRMHTNFKEWTYEIKDNELRGLDINNGNVLTSGYGYVGLYDFKTDSVTQQPQYKDFYVGAKIFDSGEMLLAGQNKFYASSNGEDWKVIERKSRFRPKRWQINDMLFTNDYEGIAVGNYGLLLYSNNQGEDWQEYRLIEDPMLFSLTQYDEKLYISSENGNIIVINIADLRE